MNKQWNDEELENVNTMGMAGDEIDVNADFEEADKLSKLSKDAYDFITLKKQKIYFIEF